MNRPPQLAAWVLRAACPARDLPFVLGDLEAEYEQYVSRERGGRQARRWFWSQALRSAGAMAMTGLRRAEWEYTLLAILVAAAGPAVVMEGFWSYLLSQVPLKADIVRGVDFVQVSLALTAALSLLAGALCSTRGLLLAVPAGCVFAMLGQAAVRNLVPAWFCPATLAAVAAALIVGACLRRACERRVV